jgi:hypothetical protein
LSIKLTFGIGTDEVIRGDRWLRPRLQTLTHGTGVYFVAIVCIIIAACMPVMASLLPPPRRRRFDGLRLVIDLARRSLGRFRADYDGNRFGSDLFATVLTKDAPRGFRTGGVMDQLLFDGWRSLLRTAIIAVLAYACLVALLRFSGRRTLSKLHPQE